MRQDAGLAADGAVNVKQQQEGVVVVGGVVETETERFGLALLRC
jgi:hypothetical protein